MSKKIKLFSVALAVFLVVLMAFVGSALAYTGGQHSNVVAGSHNVASPGANPCDECHVPHFASSAKFLWSSDHVIVAIPVTGDSGSTSDIEKLCYSCHDGLVTKVGAATAFDTSDANHRTRAASDDKDATTPGVQERGPGRDCDLCHDPHEDNHQRPDFIRSYKFGTTTAFALGPDVCANCHTGYVNGSTVGGHLPTGVPTASSYYSHVVDINAATALPLINQNPPLFDPRAGSPAGSGTAATLGVRLFSNLDNAVAIVNAGAAAGNPGSSGDKNSYTPAYARPYLQNVLATGTYIKCESCHAPHGAVVASADPYKSYLNTDKIDQGQLCSDCHDTPTP